MIRHVRPAAGRTALPSFRPCETPIPSFRPERRQPRSGEIRPATGAGRMLEPAASTERPPDFSTPPRPGAGAPVEMTVGGWSGWTCHEMSCCVRFRPVRRAAGRSALPSFRPRATPIPSFRPERRQPRSGEIRPATGAGRMLEPAASTERPPDFSTPPRPGAGAPVEMTVGGWSGWTCHEMSCCVRFRPVRRAAGRSALPSFRPRATPIPSFRPERRQPRSGEIRPATGAGRMLEPAASMERPPDFSTPPRPGPGLRSK